MITRFLLKNNLWKKDPDVMNLPWSETPYNDVIKRHTTGKLTFAIMRHDGFVKVHPPIERALSIVSERLLQAGHEVIFRHLAMKLLRTLQYQMSHHGKSNTDPKI